MIKNLYDNQVVHGIVERKNLRLTTGRFKVGLRLRLVLVQLM